MFHIWVGFESNIRLIDKNSGIHQKNGQYVFDIHRKSGKKRVRHIGLTLSPCEFYGEMLMFSGLKRF